MIYSFLENIGYFVNEIFIPLWDTGIFTIFLGCFVYYLFHIYNLFLESALYD